MRTAAKEQMAAATASMESGKEQIALLDPESLNQAYNTLAGLTEGNRLVGIISHVEDLKEKIEKQIVVTKEKSGGSKAQICI